MELACWRLNRFSLVADLSCVFVEYLLDVLNFSLIFFLQCSCRYLGSCFFQEAKNRKRKKKKRAVGRFITERFFHILPFFISSYPLPFSMEVKMINIFMSFALIQNVL